MSGTRLIRKSTYSARQAESVRQKSIGVHWRRQRGNDGKIQLLNLETHGSRAPGKSQAKQASIRAKEGKIAALEAHVVTLKEAVAKAEAAGEHHRVDAVTTRNRLDEMIAELVDMSKRMAEQAADHCAYRRRPWWKRLVG
jgi:hypothetical protein